MTDSNIQLTTTQNGVDNSTFTFDITDLSPPLKINDILTFELPSQFTNPPQTPVVTGSINYEPLSNDPLTTIKLRIIVDNLSAINVVINNMQDPVYTFIILYIIY